MPIEIKNGTHWRTSDIRRVVQAALQAGGIEPGEDVTVEVKWSADNRGFAASTGGDITIFLPRRGPKYAHPVAMVAIALEALAADSDAIVLAYSESFRVANSIAYDCARDREMPAEEIRKLYEASYVGPTQPAWAPPETFMIQKYKDPTKDGSYKDFVEAKTKEIARADRDIAKAEEELAKVQSRLKKAQVRKRNAEKSLQSARARRVGN